METYIETFTGRNDCKIFPDVTSNCMNKIDIPLLTVNKHTSPLTIVKSIAPFSLLSLSINLPNDFSYIKKV